MPAGSRPPDRRRRLISRRGLWVAAGLSLPLAAALALRSQREPDAASEPRPPSGGGSADTAALLTSDQLALVINGADPLSEAIGKAYQRARRLRDGQVIRVRFPPGRPSLSAAEFQRLYERVRQRTPAGTEAYALAWAAPWRVECVSITSAFTFGRIRSSCDNTCRSTPWNPWYARGELHRPWRELGMRPTMLLAASSLEAGRALIARGLAADGSRPPGTAYLLSSSDQRRNGRAVTYPAVRLLLGASLQVRILPADAWSDRSDTIAAFTGMMAVPHLHTIRFRPGAVADHLTSHGGVLLGPSGSSADGGNGQMSALRWLEAGATGSYGTVVEPCNLNTKFPHPGLLLSYYRRGDSLLESYWRSVAMPDQGVFIGEPLARPWPPRAG